MTAAGDTFGRDVLERVWPTLFGDAPTLVERQAVQAVSRGEGGYGRAPYRLLSIPDGAVISTVSDSNNWGATQCGHGAPCGATCFEATDTSPNKKTPDNPKGYYNTCFNRHATPDDGCASYLKTLLVKRPSVREAVKTGDADAIAAAMHATHYFEGFGATVEERIANYAKAIESNASELAASLGEALEVRRGGGGVPSSPSSPEPTPSEPRPGGSAGPFSCSSGSEP